MYKHLNTLEKSLSIHIYHCRCYNNTMVLTIQLIQDDHNSTQLFTQLHAEVKYNQGHIEPLKAMRGRVTSTH